MIINTDPDPTCEVTRYPGPDLVSDQSGLGSATLPLGWKPEVVISTLLRRVKPRRVGMLTETNDDDSSLSQISCISLLIHLQTNTGC